MTIPERLEPGLAPGGVVCVAYDLDDNELTRSVIPMGRGLTESGFNQRLLSALAVDAAEIVHARGGGRLAGFDGDDGSRMLLGPTLRYENGERVPATHSLEDLIELSKIIRGATGGPWPWMVTGVFSTAEQLAEDDSAPEHPWSNFCYTVGLGDPEVWAACASIEGRMAGHQLVGDVLNYIAAGVMLEAVQPGDSVLVPLATPEDPETARDSVWWIGQPAEASRYKVFQSPAEQCLPVLWSSPLGWPS